MKQSAAVVTRYAVKVNRIGQANQEAVWIHDTVDEAVNEIVNRNYARMDDDIMGRDDVGRADTLSGYDEAAYNKAWENLKAGIAGSVDAWYAYDDGNGHKWSIKSVRQIKVSGCGMVKHYDFDEYVDAVVSDLEDSVEMTDDLGEATCWRATTGDEADVDDAEVKKLCEEAGYDPDGAEWNPIYISNDDAEVAIADIDRILGWNPDPFPGAKKLLLDARQKLAMVIAR